VGIAGGVGLGAVSLAWWSGIQEHGPGPLNRLLARVWDPSFFFSGLSNGTGRALALQSQDIVNHAETSQWYLARVGVSNPTTISQR
jgi:hypothetical protein